MTSRDRPDEVTPAMIEAGLAVLMEWTDAIGDAPDRDMIREIYLAMTQSLGQRGSGTSSQRRST